MPSSTHSPEGEIPDPRPDLPPAGPVPELATEFSNTVRNADGTYTATVYEQPVNFENPNGDWQDISNELVDAPGPAYAVENEANSFTVSIPENPSQTPVKVATDDAWVTMKMAGSGDEAPLVDGNEAVYELGASASSVEYVAQETGLKETIVLAESPTSPPVYRYSVTTSAGLTPVLTELQRVEFRDAAGTAHFVIPRASMADSAAPEPAFSDDVDYLLTSIGEGWRLTVTPNAEWLADPTRVYPVSIDPTVENKITQKDCFLTEEAPGTTHCGESRLKVGRTNGGNRRRAVLDFNVNNIPRGVVVHNATAWLYMDASTSSGNGGATTYGMYQPEKKWGPCASWTWTCHDGQTWFGGSPLGKVSGNDPSLGGSSSGWKTWDITGRATDWIRQPNDSHGVVLRQTGGENVNKIISFYSSTTPVSEAWNARPFLNITYTNRPPTVGVPTVSPTTANPSTTHSSPTFRAAVNDPDDGLVAGCFWVWDQNWTYNIWYDCSSPWAPNNSVVSKQIPAGLLSPGQTYNVQALGADGVNWSSNWTSTTFTVDRVAPACDPMTTECPGEGCDFDEDVNCPDADLTPKRAGVPAAVNRYAPRMVLKTDEQYWPMSAGSFIDRSILKWAHDYGCPDTEWQGRPVPSYLAYATDGPYTWRTNSNVLCNPEGTGWHPAQNVWPHSDGGPGGEEGHYLDADEDTNDGDGLAGDENVYFRYQPQQQIDYWFFYGFSKTAKTASHEGDWEHISVRLNESNAATHFAFFHHEWKCKLRAEHTPRYQKRPWAYVARNSHGTYPKYADTRVGDNIVDPGESSVKWNARPNLFALSEMDWYPYGGGWGKFRGAHPGVSGPQGPSNYKPPPVDWDNMTVCDLYADDF